MKFEWNKRYASIALYTFLTLAALILFLLLLLRFDVVWGQAKAVVGYIMPILYGFGIAYILNPVMRWIENHLPRRLFQKAKKPVVKRIVSVFLTYLFFGLLLVAFFSLVIPQLLSSFYSAMNTFPDIISNMGTDIQNFLLNLVDENSAAQEVITRISTSIQQSLDSILKTLAGFIPVILSATMNVTNILINIVIGIIVSIYVLTTKEKFKGQAKKILYALFPAERVNGFLALVRSSDRSFGGFISGKLLDSLIIGILCFVGMSIFRMPYAVLISVIVGVTNVIPYFGPFFGAIPSALLLLFINPMDALGFCVFILVLQQFDGNILGPKILGQSVGVPAFWIIFSVLLFGNLFGFIGMFLGVPAFAVIYSLIRTFVAQRLKRKRYPLDTDVYSQPGYRISTEKSGSESC